MKSTNISPTKAARTTTPLPQQPPPLPTPPAQKFHLLPLSPCEDPQALIAKRAYELYSERGYRDGSALDDWLEAEREILGQVQPG